MAVSYAPRPIWIPSEVDVGVVFHQTIVNQATGAIGPARYWHHAAGRWDSMFGAAHVRKLPRPLSLASRSVLGLAVPIAVAIDPAASATVFQLDGDGGIKSVLAVIPAVDLAATTTGTIGLSL